MARGRNELERGGGLSKSIKAASFIPRSRLEALTDGVFAFAMTLLVVNIELPKGFHPKTNEDLLSGLANLSDTFIAYLITFFVLVSFWFGRAKEDGEPEMASAAYAWAVLSSSSVGHLSALLAACGREIRRTRRGLGLRCQHDSVGLVGPRHLALCRTGHRTRAPTERTCRTLYPDCVGGPFHRSLFAPAYAMLSYLLNLASPLAALAVYGR